MPGRGAGAGSGSGAQGASVRCLGLCGPRRRVRGCVRCHVPSGLRGPQTGVSGPLAHVPRFVAPFRTPGLLITGCVRPRATFGRLRGHRVCRGVEIRRKNGCARPTLLAKWHVWSDLVESTRRIETPQLGDPTNWDTSRKSPSTHRGTSLDSALGAPQKRQLLARGCVREWVRAVEQVAVGTGRGDTKGRAPTRLRWCPPGSCCSEGGG
jgi:hypothetical protein